MAFFDDKKMLLAHLRHSFITSDDTGMCELIMVNEDVEQEIENDHTFQKKSLRMQQRFKQREIQRSPPMMATSYDIQTSPTLSRRPPMKSNNNTFEIIEDKKKKKSAKSTIIAWHTTPHEQIDTTLFAPQRIVKLRNTDPSPLTRLLAEEAKKTSNPFFEYRKFNGENHGVSSTNRYSVFLSMAKDPLDPIQVTILHTATVEDLIGLTFWKYLELREPVSFKSVHHYSVMIAEDDGEIDIDLPELQRDDYISKFGFKYLGIIESNNNSEQKDDLEDESKKITIVKVHYEHGGFSMIDVKNVDVEMSEILTRVIRKRRLQIHGYELEKKDSPGEFVDLSSDLSSQGTMEFLLVRNIHRRGSFTGSEEDVDSSTERRFTQVKVALTSHQYKSFNVIRLHKMRSNIRAQLGVDPQRIEIQPIAQSGRGFMKLKSERYDIDDICACVMLNEDKGSGNSVFRITRLGREGYKNMDFEAPSGIAKEIVTKVTMILNDIPSDLRTEYKENFNKRRGSKLVTKD